jgi:hypothetical protein
LHKRLSEAIDAVIADYAEPMLETLKERAQEAQISVESVTAWFTKERKADVEINMVRNFLTYFATYYETKAKELGGAEEEEER